MFPVLIQDAIDAPADFTRKFTKEVDAIRAELQSQVSVPVSHHSEMNYANGQRLAFCLDDEGNPTAQEQAAYEMQIHISSKARLFAIYNLNRVGKNEWRPISEADLPHQSVNPIRLTEAMLKSMGYERVANAYLSKEVPGHFTELDGVPATVFEVLFSELT